MKKRIVIIETIMHEIFVDTNDEITEEKADDLFMNGEGNVFYENREYSIENIE